MQFNDLGKQWETIRESVLVKIDRLGFQGSYINGPAVSEFETEFSKHYGSKYSVGVSNGTDGLKLALQMFDLTFDLSVVSYLALLIKQIRTIHITKVQCLFYPVIDDLI